MAPAALWHTGRVPYWIDGNNVAAISSADKERGREKRRALLEHLSILRGSRGGRFVVYFDGDDADRRIPPSGVQVRYAAPRSADAAIVDHLRAAAKPREVTVVTNDHELANRCRHAGARTMRWGEFAERSQRPVTTTRPTKGGAAEEPPVKLADWKGYLGLTDSDLEG